MTTPSPTLLRKFVLALTSLGKNLEASNPAFLKKTGSLLEYPGGTDKLEFFQRRYNQLQQEYKNATGGTLSHKKARIKIDEQLRALETLHPDLDRLSPELEDLSTKSLINRLLFAMGAKNKAEAKDVSNAVRTAEGRLVIAEKFRPLLPKPSSDAVSDRTWFHGGADLSNAKTLKEFQSRMENLVGPGLYQSDDPGTALSYVKYRGKGVLNAIRLKPGNYLDLDKEEAAVKLSRIARAARFPSPPVSPYGLGSVARKFGDLPGVDYIQSLYTGAEQQVQDKYALRKAWQRMLDIMGRERIAGFQHTGGIVTGGGRHNVVVATNPAQSVESATPMVSLG